MSDDSAPVPHMSPDEFRRHGHAVIDWIANYMEQVESLPVLSQVLPGEIRSMFPAEPPADGEPFEDMLQDMDDFVMAGITHWQSPNFFAYFPSNSSGAGILGDLISSGLGVQGMLWATSPACTEIESLVMDWLVDMLGLPDRFHSTTKGGGGVIHDSASSATLCALLCAREKVTDYVAGKEGVDTRLVVYASEHAHSSVAKAVRIAGIGTDRLRSVPADADHAMRADALEAMIAEDKAAGLVPCCVIATVGSTSSLAIDPVPAIGALCQREGIWLHVDGAMAGTAAVCPELRFIHEGLELADSYCTNPHKWMGVTFDCTAYFVADRHALVRTMGIMPEYLRNEATASGAVIDYRDWQIPLGRRFRALKLWFTIRHYGVKGLQAMVRGHVAMAKAFAGWIEADARFELMAPVNLNLVCFRHLAGDEANEGLMDACNRSGAFYFTHTKLNDTLTLRLAVGQLRTEMRHVEAVWKRLEAMAGDPVT
jgi:aromatic-L-amino-acid decarboxylase